jgi:hypothetical protein
MRPAKTGHNAVADTPVRGVGVCRKQGDIMNLLIWLPLAFVLGLGSLALCLVFVDACDRI